MVALFVFFYEYKVNIIKKLPIKGSLEGFKVLLF